MEDNRWGLRGEDGVAGNILAGTVDAVWVPLDIAYGLTEASPDVIMPESFKTGMVASYLAGERGATQRMLDTLEDSRNRNHPMNYPPMWNKTLERRRITWERLKLWVMNLGTGQQGTTSWRQGPTHVCLYKNAGGEWRVPEGDRKGGETLRQAASRIASDRLGLRINTEDWQHLGEEGEGGGRTQNWVVYQEEQINLDKGAALEIVRLEE